jgi:ABC-type Fe3+-hydroxamate transport system substrate-binding protein
MDAGPAQDDRGLRDDLGLTVRLGAVRRVVSLVPSLTEAVAVTAPGLLVGATAWCTHPAGLDVVRIGGTKNPDTARIIALAPDLVLANEEENRLVDLEALRTAGVPVWVTRIRTLDQALRSLDRLLTAACDRQRPAWLDEAEDAWRTVPSAPRGLGAAGGVAVRPRAVVPVWRRPWMVLGRDTFAGDLLRRLGVDQLHADHPDRYPALPIDRLLRDEPDLAVLPDEPYRFTDTDGPEAFPGVRAALVSGRHLTWYGPSLAEAAGLLSRQLRSGS